MLFIFLLRINANSMTLHYFNNSQNSQQYPSRQHLCTAGNNLDIVAAINESCRNQEIPPEVLPNEEVACCRNVNISIGFYERMMEIHFYNSIIELLVDYLNCARKSKNSIILTLSLCYFLHYNYVHDM